MRVPFKGSQTQGIGLNDGLTGWLNDWLRVQLTNCSTGKMKIYLSQRFIVKGKSHHITCQQG